jgi:hypothetical protein
VVFTDPESGCVVLAPPGHVVPGGGGERPPGGHAYINKASNDTVLLVGLNDEGWPPCDGLAAGLFFYRYGFAADDSLRGRPSMTKEFGFTGWWPRPVQVAMCVNSKCALPYDGVEDGLFRWSQVTMFATELFRGYDSQLLSSGTTYQSYVEQIEEQYAAHGCRGFVKSDTFNCAHNAFTASKPQLFHTAYRCPICQAAPGTLTCDGKTLKLSKRLTKDDASLHSVSFGLLRRNLTRLLISVPSRSQRICATCYRRRFTIARVMRQLSRCACRAGIVERA